MNIRLYQPADFAGCLEAFDSNYPEFFAEHERPEFEALLHELAATNAQETLHYFVVEHQNRIAACAGFYLPKDQNAPAGLVWGMVARDFHRQGVGKKLLAFRLERIQALRPGASVMLDTTQLSYPFFEKAGFRITGVIKDHYAPGLDRYDMIWERDSNE